MKGNLSFQISQFNGTCESWLLGLIVVTTQSMNDWIYPSHRFPSCNFEESAAVSCLEWWLTLSDVLGFYAAFLWHGSLGGDVSTTDLCYLSTFLSPIVVSHHFENPQSKLPRSYWHGALFPEMLCSKLWSSWPLAMTWGELLKWCITKGKLLEIFFWVPKELDHVQLSRRTTGSYCM